MNAVLLNTDEALVLRCLQDAILWTGDRRKLCEQRLLLYTAPSSYRSSASFTPEPEPPEEAWRHLTLQHGFHTEPETPEPHYPSAAARFAPLTGDGCFTREEYKALAPSALLAQRSRPPASAQDTGARR